MSDQSYYLQPVPVALLPSSPLCHFKAGEGQVYEHLGTLLRLLYFHFGDSFLSISHRARIFVLC